MANHLSCPQNELTSTWTGVFWWQWMRWQGKYISGLLVPMTHPNPKTAEHTSNHSNKANISFRPCNGFILLKRTNVPWPTHKQGAWPQAPYACEANVSMANVRPVTNDMPVWGGRHSANCFWNKCFIHTGLGVGRKISMSSGNFLCSEESFCQ